MTIVNQIPADLRREVTEVLMQYRGSTLPVYAEAEKIRLRFQTRNIALEDVIAMFVEASGSHSVSIAFDPSEARDALLGRSPSSSPVAQLVVTDDLRRRGDTVAANDVGGLLPDHDGRGIGVGTADLRHDGTVAHPEAIETVNAELRRNH